MEWLAALILPVLAGFVAGRIARDKGRSPALWRWLTFFCCPLLIVLILLPAKGAAGAGIATEAFAAALIILALVGAGIYALSGSGASPHRGRRVPNAIGSATTRRTSTQP